MEFSIRSIIALSSWPSKDVRPEEPEPPKPNTSITPCICRVTSVTTNCP
ncbi:hypothetical protein [Streptomyces sp. SM10]|nr:hypothetical protein [Streptomyces sp. SM10]